jgi:hypothetical protein
MSKVFIFLGVASIVIVTFWPLRLFPHEVVTTTVTYDREITQILKKKCIMCHSEHNLGMPLTSYEETRPWSRAIEDEVLGRHMPPWRAVQGYGQFANDFGLTNRELQFMVSWVEGNGPKTKDQTNIVDFGGDTPLNERLKMDFGQWRLGNPDLKKTLPANVIRTGDAAQVRRVTIDLGLNSGKSIRALEFHPGDRRVLRGAYFFLEDTGQWLGSWTPWFSVTTLPQDTAYRIPADAHIVAELHYQRASESVEDRSTLGVYLTAKPTTHHPSQLVLDAKPLETPNADMQRFAGSVRIPADNRILAFRPELTPGIKSIEVTARRPDGTVEVLLLIKDALPEWPTPYILSQPVSLPKNTELAVTAYYDRSPDKHPPASFLLTVSLNDGVEIAGHANPSPTSGHR